MEVCIAPVKSVSLVDVSGLFCVRVRVLCAACMKIGGYFVVEWAVTILRYLLFRSPHVNTYTLVYRVVVCMAIYRLGGSLMSALLLGA